MKIVTILAAVILFSGSIFATDLTGAAAQKAYEEVKGFEYTVAGITKGLEYRLTVRHNDSIECQKEETLYPFADKIVTEYSCREL